ncbi:hypothetical protein [Pseudomonas viridiflava]|uniref:hypothetical protein n=1 Tax=Pseudomonas viridiflava TaxID=33069 RepID=UPI000F041278|nr:hypothetical protein [Pseudomonas viridiflava]MEE4124022.1 hypothetical protein [Pseudomonas viridiflava]
MTNHYQYTCTTPPAVLIKPVKLILEDLALEVLNSYRRLRHEFATCEASGDEAAVERARSLLHFAEGRLGVFLLQTIAKLTSLCPLIE